jgi:hypothetical protein
VATNTADFSERGYHLCILCLRNQERLATISYPVAPICGSAAVRRFNGRTKSRVDSLLVNWLLAYGLHGGGIGTRVRSSHSGQTYGCPHAASSLHQLPSVLESHSYPLTIGCRLIGRAGQLSA